MLEETLAFWSTSLPHLKDSFPALAFQRQEMFHLEVAQLPFRTPSNRKGN